MRKTVASVCRHSAQQLVAHQQARLLIERAERLVEKDQAGLHHQRARDAHALAHPAGELRGIARREVGEADELQNVAHALVALRAVESEPAQAERDVVGDIEPGQRRVVLEHDADSVRRLGADRPAFERDRSFGRRRESRDQLEQRRLAAPRRADDGEELAAPKLEIDRPERVQRRRRAADREDLADVGAAETCSTDTGGASRRDGYFNAFRSSGRNRVSMILL